MAIDTAISWCKSTVNFWIGCTEAGPGCDNCYAKRMDARKVYGGATHWGPGVPRFRTLPDTWDQLRRWNAAAPGSTFAGRRGYWPVFINSMSDFFDNEVPEEWRVEAWAAIKAAPNLTILIVTKRIGNAARMLPPDWGDGYPNVMLLATVVNQPEADRDVPKLLRTPAAARGLSIEPMLGDIRLGSWLQRSPSAAFEAGKVTADMPAWPRIGSTAIEWVICGGESGPKARPMHPDWARGLRNECATAGVGFHFKQWGSHDLSYDRDRDDPDYRRCDAMERRPGRWINLAGGHGFSGERVHYAHRVGPTKAGRLLDGRTHDDMPEVQRG